MSHDSERQQDSYYVKYLTQYLDRPGFALTGIDLRMFSMMGDGVAISIIKALYPNRPVNGLTLKKILVALRASLEHPGDIREESDRIPAVTLSLLENLLRRAQLPDERISIESLIETLRQRQLSGGLSE